MAWPVGGGGVLSGVLRYIQESGAEMIDTSIATLASASVTPVRDSTIKLTPTARLRDSSLLLL